MLTLADAKAHLNQTTDVDDDLIAAKLTAASEWVALYIGSDVSLETTPAPVREAILKLTADLYASRENTLIGITAQSLPNGFLDLLDPYRAWCF